MNLEFIDDLDARQQELDRERKEARQLVIQELQLVIDRLSIKPEELKFATTRTRKNKRSKKTVEFEN